MTTKNHLSDKANIVKKAIKGANKEQKQLIDRVTKKQCVRCGVTPSQTRKEEGGCNVYGRQYIRHKYQNVTMEARQRKICVEAGCELKGWHPKCALAKHKAIMNKKQAVEAKIRELVPETMTTIQSSKISHNIHSMVFLQEPCEITLPHVLMAISELKLEALVNAHINNYGEFVFRWNDSLIDWQLGEPLSEQPNEVHEFLFKLLKLQK